MSAKRVTHCIYTWHAAGFRVCRSSRIFVHTYFIFWGFVFLFISCADARISLFLLSSGNKEQCVPEVSGRAAAVGNSRWVTLQPSSCSVWVMESWFLLKISWRLKPRVKRVRDVWHTPFAKTYRQHCFYLATVMAFWGLNLWNLA